MTYIRNLLIVVGIYYLSWWVMSPIFMIHTKLTTGVTYSGGILGSLLMGIVSALPVALVAFGSGILSHYALEGTKKEYWTALLALFYAVNGFTGFHWAQQPELSDRFYQATQGIFPALTCYLGGAIISKTKAHKIEGDT